MPEPKVPAPAAMPVDMRQWLKELHMSNFHNAYYEYRDTRACLGDQGKILVVGPGQGLGVAVLRARGYEVTTYDIDPEVRPDYQGSVHEMKDFGDGQFDLVIASHVLEHMSFALLDGALRELGRVARFALVYLPFAGRHIDLSLSLPREFHLRLNLPAFWRRPSLERPRFAAGQHFWEIGVWGVGRTTVQRAMEKHFEVLDSYQNPHWLVSMNFVLRSLRRPAR
jgi:hypothetical protein